MTHIIKKMDVLESNEYDKFVGGKALGFKVLKDLNEWIPDFVILNSAYIKNLKSKDFDSIKADVLKLIDLECKGLNEFYSTQRKIIVRSSAENEALENRGEHDSIVCEASRLPLIETIATLIFKWFNSSYSSLSLALIIQKHIVTEAKGHISNERRVSQYARYWLVDYEENRIGAQLNNERFPIFKNRLDKETLTFPTELFANTFKDVNQALHRPAEFITLYGNGIRTHFEWVWDGRKVWIVQADQEQNKPGKNPNHFISDQNLKALPVKPKTSFQILENLKSIKQKNFGKTLHQSQFQNAGLDTTDLWFCLASEVFDNQNKLILRARNDFILLLALGPIVIRTDLDKSLYKNQEQRQNLPRSSTLKNILDVDKFLENSLVIFQKRKYNISNVCFILHNYIPSISSAFSYADPKNPKVRVDSIWGLPDGLQYYSHDSFEVNTKDAKTSNSKVRHKNFMLGATTDGDWIHSEVEVPYDWRESISEKNRVRIAKDSFKLAQYLNKAVQIMWFVGTAEDSSHPVNIPWYIEDREVEEFKLEKQNTIYSRNLFKVTNYDDLARAKPTFSSVNTYSSILLYPSDEIIRDNDFLKQVAELSIEFDKSIIFSGSILQHAFYQLRSFGALVSCFEPFVPKQEILEYDKLVRDKIPDIILQDGEKPEIRKANLDEHISRLEDKIIEEATEIATAESKQDRIEEIADALEVIEVLCGLEEIDLKDVLKEKKAKKLKAGSFNEGYILLSSKTLPAIKAENVFSEPLRGRKLKHKRKNLKKYNAGLQMSLFDEDDIGS